MKRFILPLIIVSIPSIIYGTTLNYNDYLNNDNKITDSEIQSKFKASPSKKAAQPKWIKTFPKDEQYFTGIGSVSYTGNLSQDINAAINQALMMIASQIETSISAASSLSESSTEKTINGKKTETSKEQYNSQIKSFVKMTLEGVELVDSWYNEKKGVYAYCRLSIAKYNELRQKKLQYAIDTAKNGFVSAMDAFRAADYKKAFIMFATIVSATFPFPTDAINISYNGQNYNAVTESQNKLKTITSDLSYEAINSTTQTIKDAHGSFVYKLTFGGKPIEGLPIYCVNAGGRNITYTDNKGQFEIIPEGVTKDKNKIFFGLDIESVCQSSFLDPTDYIALEKALYTARSINVKFSGLQAYINADSSLESSVNALSEYLTAKYNAQIIDDMENAPFIVTLTTDAAALPANKSKFRVAEGSLTLQLKQNTAKSKNIVSVTFDREKENGMSDAQAIGNVLECFADGIADGYRAKLDEEFDKLNISVYSIED